MRNVGGMVVQEVLLRFINDDLLAGAKAVTADDEIVLDGTVDSLGVARLVGFMEAEFQMTIPPEDITIEHFRTVGTLAGYVQGRTESVVDR